MDKEFLEKHFPDYEEMKNDPHKLSDFYLICSDRLELDENICQAAFATSWIRLCEAMGIPKKVFIKMLDDLKNSYKND